MSVFRVLACCGLFAALVSGCDGGPPVGAASRALSTGGQGVWLRLADQLPTPRDYHTVVEVPSRQSVWMFGGLDYDSGGTLWEWDGASWTALGEYPELARALAVAAFDPVTEQVLVFGGRNYMELASNDLWSLDTHTTPPVLTPRCDETHLCPGEPPDMVFHGAAFDSARERFVVFGGIGNDGTVWEWSQTGGWQAKCEQGACGGPTTRQFPVYAPAQGKLFVFDDGLTGTPWSWDGAAFTSYCTKAPCSLLRPSTRGSFGVAYSETLGRVALFGGNAQSDLQSDLWTWDGAQWRSYGNGGPSPRWVPGFAWHRARSQFVVFGGRAEETRGDTWTLSLDLVATWNNASVGLPARRDRANLIYRAVNEPLWLFGGSFASVQDLWSWNGERWAEECRAGTLCGVAPNPAAAPGALWVDFPGQDAWLFGASLGGATLNASWNSFAGWTPKTPAQSPAATTGGAYAYDPIAMRLLLVGGRTPSSYVDDQWVLSPSGLWTPFCVGMTCGTRPSARVDGAMAYDARRDVMVLYGGGDGEELLDDLWELQAGQWVQRTIPNGPGPRKGHAMVFDDARGVIVLTGGVRTATDLTDTWEYDGASWRAVTEAPRTEMVDAAITWDPHRRRLVSFGGSSVQSDTITAETWEYHMRGNTCGTDAECDTGHCLDGVCCETSTCAPCERCDGATPGLCSTVINDIDPECVGGVCGPTGHCGAANGAACTTGATCASTYCSSQGECAGPAELGADCGADADCDSNLCVDGVCCGSRCDGPCERCDVAGSRGTCSATPGVDLDGDCAGQGAVGCAGVCTAQRTCAMPGLDERCNTCLACNGAGGCTQGRGDARDDDCGPVVCAELSTECRVYDSAPTTVGYCDDRACATARSPGACPAWTDLPDGTACGLGACVAGECVETSPAAGAGCHCAYATTPLAPAPWALLVGGFGIAYGRWRARRDSSRVRAKNHS